MSQYFFFGFVLGAASMFMYVGGIGPCVMALARFLSSTKVERF